jgi:hypothetical protein
LQAFIVAIYPSVEDALSKAISSYPGIAQAGLRHRELSTVR